MIKQFDKYQVVKSVVLIFPLLFLCRCAPVIDYSMETVPEEGGIHLTRFTTDEENTIATAVYHNSNNTLTWGGARYLAVSPDGSKLAFVRQVDYKDNIYIKNTAGGTSAIQRTFRNAVSDVCFSPDSKYIAFSEMLNGFSHIYMMNASEGSAVQEITSANNYDDLNPAFSPDGNLIFFSRIEKQITFINNAQTASYSGNFSIWSYNLKTGLLTQYDEGFDPSPMADGKTIVVCRANKQTGMGEIWTLNIESGAVTEILSSPRMGFSNPAISPDGKKIVCVGSTPATAARPANLDIYTVNIDGTSLTQLTFHPADDMCPAWSADGKTIYFISGRASRVQKYNVWQMVYTKMM